ncbi:MAG: MATE family efflux transporter [Actinomycetota bacterium]|nr:MATE family efflux transporter [Actinomycetota bacterium]
MLSTLAIGGFFFILIMAIPGPILRMFSADTRLISLATQPLRVIVALFPLIGFQVIGAGFFQSIGKATPSIILSMSRQMLFLIPLILLLPLAMGIWGIWLSFPIADFLAIVLTGIFVFREIKYMETQVKIEPACQES